MTAQVEIQDDGPPKSYHHQKAEQEGGASSSRNPIREVFSEKSVWENPRKKIWKDSNIELKFFFVKKIICFMALIHFSGVCVN